MSVVIWVKNFAASKYQETRVAVFACLREMQDCRSAVGMGISMDMDMRTKIPSPRQPW